MRIADFRIVVAIFSVSFLTTAHAEEEHQSSETVTTPAIRIFADPLHTSATDHGSAISVVDRDALVESGALTIGDILDKTPGVHSTSFAGSASRPVIRGFSGERIRVLRNGVGTFDASSISDDHAVPADPLNANSVEIFRGPETLLFGSNAIGGVANVVERSIAEQDALYIFGGETVVRYGSGDNERTGASFIEGGANGYNYFASGFYSETNDYEIPGTAESKRLRSLEQMLHLEEESDHDNDHTYEDDHDDLAEVDHDQDLEDGERVANSGLRNRGFTVGSSHTWEKGYLGFAVSGFLSDYGVPGHTHGVEDEDSHDHEDGSHDSDHEIDDHDLVDGEEDVTIEMKQLRADVRGEARELDSFFNKVRYNLGMANYKHTEFEGSEAASIFENDALEGRVELAHGDHGEQHGFIGTQLQYSDFVAVGEEAFVPSSETLSSALFALEELPVDEQLRLQVGARYEFQEVDPEAESAKEFHLASASTGVVWNSVEKDYGSSLTFAYTERGLTATELFANGVHAATRSFEQGDSSLDKERSWGSDLNFSKRQGFLQGAANIFYQQYDNYIGLLPTGDVEDGFSAFQYTEVQARFWGYEVETTFNLFESEAHDVDLNAQVDYVRAINISDSNTLPRTPPLRTVVELAYKGNGFGASLEGVFVEEQKRVTIGELETSDYQMLNASAYTAIPSPTELASLQLFLVGTNLNDTEARSHSSFLKDLAPLRGRSVLVGLRSVF